MRPIISTGNYLPVTVRIIKDVYFFFGGGGPNDCIGVTPAFQPHDPPPPKQQLEQHGAS